ncbi:MAG: ATP-binding cassette domain-containing protein [Prevotellaceae bacterium]|jgi:ATPase subunit of ABC transporter with duplicated ATPase domains|nr:ATP-binding cassette domain-containing protein [Prevotellaceae bacterium]
MSIIVNSLSYTHQDKEILFENINFSVSKGEKAALVGNNGAGKSTLLQIIAGHLQKLQGEIALSATPYYVPQHLGQYDNCSVAQALRIAEKLDALHAILSGNVSAENFARLDDNWDIEEKTQAAFSLWKLQHLQLSQPMKSLSGGEKTKVFLAGISIYSPSIILLDEPSNHLDMESRDTLYELIKRSNATILVVSHDRTLLNLLPITLELSKQKIEVYGGNYDFYVNQKTIEKNALNQDIKTKEKALRKAKETERETLERKQKADARGKKKQEKAGLPKILMDGLKNNAEKSTSRLKNIHVEKINELSQDINQLRKELPDKDKMKIAFENSELHKQKIIVKANNINFGYNGNLLWKNLLSFVITSGERIVIKGNNGSGKTTLIKIILGELNPQAGSIERAAAKTVYIDQSYSLVDNSLTVYQQAEKFNSSAMLEHEIKIRLTRFLFTGGYWDKPCQTLSGGERMRLLLCCLTISRQTPDIIILDEPTNNLDIQNIEILTAAVNEYQGTLIVVSHDLYFLKEISAERCIKL